MRRLNIKTGQKFNKLTVIEEVEGRQGFRYFKCSCECGGTTVIQLFKLTSGRTKSCGCLWYQGKHNLYKARIHHTWRDIKTRCLNSNCKSFKNYGGRGIKVCEKWLEFLPFYKWATTNGYKDNLTIERVNVNGNYEPGNCTWIPIEQQGLNRRCSKTFSKQELAI